MKLRGAIQLVGLSAALACLSACGTTSVPTPPALPDVYAVGFETAGNLFKAVLWKNNAVTILDSGIYGARAEGIVVANNHVYVVGFEGSSNGNNVAVLWTDGVPTPLTDGTGSAIAYAVAVSGTDVYVVGNEQNYNATAGTDIGYAVYWKNGSPTVLNDGPGSGSALSTFVQSAGANAIAIDGSDIYIAGVVGAQTQTAPNNYTNEPVITYWKNGVPTYVTSGLEFAEISGIAVQNGHVYITGSNCTTFTSDCDTATLWTDGVASSLTPNFLSVASGLAFAGSNIYAAVNVTDTSGNTAELSSNGTLSPLSTTNKSAANSVTTYGTDVYVGGAENDTAGYWRNGNLTVLTGVPTGPNIIASVYAIAVVPSS